MGDADWITKCPCGQNQDADGLMIQCESCMVWQHGDCVGVFAKANAPERYFCEKCKPQHRIHQEARRRRAEVTQARQIRITRARNIRMKLEMTVDPVRSARKPHRKRSRATPKANTPRSSSFLDRGESSTPRPSREQRKLERVLETFKRMEDKSARKKTSGDRREHPGTDRKRRGRPRRAKRKVGARRAAEEPRGAIPVGKLFPLSPMYLGRKAWLMRLHRRDQMLSKLTGYEHLANQELPLHKRVLMNFKANHAKKAGVNGAVKCNGSGGGPSVGSGGDGGGSKVEMNSGMKSQEVSQKMDIDDGLSGTDGAKSFGSITKSPNGHPKKLSGVNGNNGMHVET